VAVRRARSARRQAQQHFLRSSRLAAEIVGELELRREELVVEIGPGDGRLTAELSRRADRVIAIELDPVLGAAVRARFDNVAVVDGDVLRVPLPQEPFRVVGNIPFNRTTAILRRLLDDPRTPFARGDVIVEWGFARKRTAVWPSTLLGVAWGPWFELVLVRRIPARCFAPAPSVGAALLRVTRRTVPLVSTEEAGEYVAFVRRAFAEKRVADCVPPLTLKRVADRLGFDRRSAPRELDVHQWAVLFAASRSK
jgi:23S rRNA (adenine-N6)-dimethyltransferase